MGMLLSIYLSIMSVCKFSPLQIVGQPPDARRSVSTNSVYGQTAGVRTMFPAHCAGVINMFPRDNLFPAVKTYHRHRSMRSTSASEEKLTT